MEEKKEDYQRSSEEKSSKLTDEYLQRASYLGTILPLLDIAYETLIEKTIKKYDLNIVKEFWIYFGLLILTWIYYYFGLRLEVVIFFLFATLFTLIVYNLAFFKKRLIPDETIEIRQFISEIEKKTFAEVIEFIKGYRNKLKDDDIQKIIDSMHGNNWALYKFILSYQKFSSNILIHIVKTNKFDIIGEDLYKKYIQQFNVGMTIENYRFLVENFKDNKKILKIINKYNPAYLRTGSIFKTVAISIQSFYVSVRLGKISDIIKFLSILLIAVIAIFNFNQIASPYMRMELYQSFPLLFLINYFLAMAIAAGIIMILLTYCLIILTKIIWCIIGFFAPNQPQ